MSPENQVWLILTVLIVAPYLYGWLRIEIFSWVRENLDENLAKAWLMPKYKHYLRYISIKFVCLIIKDWPKTDDEKEYAKKVVNNIFFSNIPKYVLEGNLLGGKPEKIKSLWSWIRGR